MRTVFFAATIAVSATTYITLAQVDDKEYSPQVVINRAFPPITKAPFVSANETSVSENELIIGVVVNGKARAYPVNQLTGPRREIINDTLDGTHIAATW